MQTLERAPYFWWLLAAHIFFDEKARSTGQAENSKRERIQLTLRSRPDLPDSNPEFLTLLYSLT